jgi:hypothetical protein
MRTTNGEIDVPWINKKQAIQTQKVFMFNIQLSCNLNSDFRIFFFCAKWNNAFQSPSQPFSGSWTHWLIKVLYSQYYACGIYFCDDIHMDFDGLLYSVNIALLSVHSHPVNIYLTLWAIMVLHHSITLILQGDFATLYPKVFLWRI